MSHKIQSKSNDSDDVGSAYMRFELIRMVLLGMAIINMLLLIKSSGTTSEPSSALMDLVVRLPMDVLLTIAYLVLGFKAEGASTVIAANENGKPGERAKLWGLVLLILAVVMVIANWAVFPFGSLR